MIAPILSILKYCCLVWKVFHVFRFFFRLALQLFFQRWNVWTSRMIFFESLDSIDQIVSGHVLHLQRNWVMNVFIKPFGCQSKVFSTIVSICNSLSCKKTTFDNELLNLLTVILPLLLKIFKFLLDSFLIATWLLKCG